MSKKIMITISSCFVLLIGFYLISFSFHISYKKVKNKMEIARDNLQSTDLSELYICGYQLGDALRDVPRDFRGLISCEDNFFGAMYEPRVGDSIISKITSYLYFQVEYKGVVVENNKELSKLLGKNFIYQKTPDAYIDNVKIYLDKEHNIELHVESDHENLSLKKLGISELYYKCPRASILEYWKDPINVLINTIDRANDTYIDSRYVDWSAGFSNFDLIVLPVYFTATLIPLVIFAVFRNKIACCIFASTTGVYIMAFCVINFLSLVKQ